MRFSCTVYRKSCAAHHATRQTPDKTDIDAILAAGEKKTVWRWGQDCRLRPKPENWWPRLCVARPFPLFWMPGTFPSGVQS
jgi:hypothetical protein